MELSLILEIFAVAMGLVFLLLLIAENIWCWLFGILSSSAFVVLMFMTKLYSESLLYVFYIGIGVYGWYKWRRPNGEKLQIKNSSISSNIILLVLGVILSFIIGSFFANNTDAQRPFADASSSVFSIIASYMEANKWLSAWIFWIVINAFSIWLYFDRSLNLSSFLMVVYFLLSIFGFMQWRKKLLAQTVQS